MRKIFSFMLIAAGLLISTQSWAAEEPVKVTIDSTDTYYNDLASAFGSIADNQTATITLVGDVEKMTGATPNGSNLQVTNGKKITFNLNGHNAEFYFYGINVNNGWFTVTGKGTLTFSGKYGTLGTQDNTYNNMYKFIGITGSTDPTKEKYSYLNIGEEVSINAFGYGFGMLDNSGCAYGAVVDFYGHMTTVWGCTINGMVQKIPGQGDVPEDAYIPEINIYSGSTIIGGMYCAGYAKYYIAGTIQSNEDAGGDGYGIYMKAGQLIIDGGIVTSTSNTYEEPVYNGSGSTGGSGCAIVIDAVSGYAGAVSVEIKGDATITANSGYALYELSTDNSGTVVITNGIQIKGGEFTGNADKGTIKTSGVVQDKVKINGGITGGTFSDDKIKDYVSNVNGVIEVQEVGGQTVYVVNGMPEGKTWIATIAAAQSTDYVKIEADEEVSSNKEIAYLNIPDSNKVTIKSGAKLSVGEAVLGKDAQIIVEAGARLVVNGTNGLIAFETTNLVLKAAAGEATGMFVLNPDVKANKQPMATLEYISKAYTLGYNASLGKTEYMWEMFTSPFASISTASRNPNQPSIFQHVVNGQFANFADWGTGGDVRSAKPFELIAITNTSNQNTDVKYTFTGQLQGSNDAAFSLQQGFNYLGNGYTALLNAKQVISALQQSSENVRTLLYVWEFDKQGWKCYNGYRLSEIGNINPLTAFVLYADENAYVNMDYEKLIWNVNK